MGYLDRHSLLKSSDLDEFRAIMERELGRHDLTFHGSRRGFEARVCAAQLADLVLFHVSFGEVSLELSSRDAEEETFVFGLVTSGSGTIDQGCEALNMSADRAYMRDMRRPMVAEQCDFGGFALNVPLARLRDQAEALFGPGAAGVDLRFRAAADLQSAAGRHLRQSVHFVAYQLDSAPPGTIGPPVLAAWEDLLLVQLLTALPNSLEDFAARAQRSGALPYHVKRAREFIEAHAREKISLIDLAQAAGCSLRTLQAAFVEATGLSPMAYLRAARLEGAHRDLRRAEPGTTVAEIARRWGLAHLGRFARDYRRRYGRNPVETLRDGL